MEDDEDAVPHCRLEAHSRLEHVFGVLADDQFFIESIEHNREGLRWLVHLVVE